MAESRVSLLRSVFKPWWVRIGGGIALIFTLINGYAGVQDQFEVLPKLQDVVTVPHLGFMPWWGWMLAWLFLLQTMFLYSLFEHVRLRPPTTQQPAAAPRAAPAAPPSVKQQLGSWAHVDTFKVSEAACLWAGFLPSASYIYQKSRHPEIVGAERLIVSQMGEAVDMQSAPWGSDDLAVGNIHRTALVALAERNGVRPAFLYPDG